MTKEKNQEKRGKRKNWRTTARGTYYRRTKKKGIKASNDVHQKRKLERSIWYSLNGLARGGKRVYTIQPEGKSQKKKHESRLKKGKG